jgi:hypothetical protein
MRVLRPYLCPSRPMECSWVQGWYVYQLQGLSHVMGDERALRHQALLEMVCYVHQGSRPHLVRLSH